jgi:DMSO/TMAO reductase YedYZ molybdopterin-dependent catalytic subunit
LDIISRSDRKDLIKDAEKRLPNSHRRLFLKNSLSLGALTMLTGCNLTGTSAIDSFLMAISRLNDQAQARLFNPRDLAPEYPAHMVTNPFPFNAYYSESQIRPVPANYQLRVGGLVADKRPVTLESLFDMPQTSHITRHICVEGWSAIGQWGGVRFSDFLTRIGADTTAKYVRFQCFDDYFTSIDMPTALHPQTLLALTHNGQILPAKYGAPMKLRIPTKLGFKNPKYIAEIFITNDYPGGFWENQGYNWFAGL